MSSSQMADEVKRRRHARARFDDATQMPGGLFLVEQITTYGTATLTCEHYRLLP